MASPYKRVNWPDLRAEYVSDQRATYASIAKKYGITAKAVEWHSSREGWTSERRVHSEKVREKLGDLTAGDAAESLAAIYRQHLNATKELREMLAHKLKVPTADGQFLVRPDISVGDLARVAAAYAQLLESDRVALGADELSVNHPRDPFTDLSDEQLFARLRSTLERHPTKTLQ